MFTACFPTEPFFFGFLGYVRGDAPGAAVGRALFAKYILGAPFFFGPSPTTTTTTTTTATTTTTTTTTTASAATSSHGR